MRSGLQCPSPAPPREQPGQRAKPQRHQPWRKLWTSERPQGQGSAATRVRPGPAPGLTASLGQLPRTHERWFTVRRPTVGLSVRKLTQRRPQPALSPGRRTALLRHLHSGPDGQRWPPAASERGAHRRLGGRGSTSGVTGGAGRRCGDARQGRRSAMG